jgi:hypothetical protein
MAPPEPWPRGQPLAARVAELARQVSSWLVRTGRLRRVSSWLARTERLRRVWSYMGPEGRRRLVLSSWAPVERRRLALSSRAPAAELERPVRSWLAESARLGPTRLAVVP